MLSTTLTSLALLKSRFDVEKKDIIDTFIPFADYVLAKNKIVTFEPKDLKKLIEDEFGLIIPQDVISNLSNRMKRRGLLKQEHHIYIVDKHNINIASFEEQRDLFNTRFDSYIDGLCQYSKEYLKRDLPQDIARRAIFEYFDQYAIECIEVFQRNSIFPGLDKKETSSQFLISSYINYLSTKDREKYELTITALTGRMLSNALLARDLSTSAMKFRNTTIFIDTPLALQIINALGDELYIFSNEILNLYKKADAKIAIFQHTIDEISTILRSAEMALAAQTGGYGDVLSSLKTANKTASDITLLRVNIPRELERLEITVVPIPSYHHKIQIDERELEKEMEKGGLFYKNEAAKLADINSIRSLHILRAGNRPTRVEDCRAILVTTNSTLARIAYSFGKSYPEFYHVSPIITCFSLTNVIWLKSPISYREIPQKIIESQCLAALTPSDELWNAFLGEINKLQRDGRITPEQHKLLRYELRVREELMNLTSGDEKSLTEYQVFQILDRYTQKVTQPWVEKADHLSNEVNELKLKIEKDKQAINLFLAKRENLKKKMAMLLKGILVLIGLIFYSISEGWFFRGLISNAHPVIKIVAIAGSIFIFIASIFSFFSGFILLAPINWLSNKFGEKISNLFFGKNIL